MATLSPLTDSRATPLAKLTPALIDEAVRRVIPDAPAAAPVFNSAI